MDRTLKILCMVLISENFDDYADIDTDTYATNFLCKTTYKRTLNKINKNDVKKNGIIFEKNCIIIKDENYKYTKLEHIMLGIVPILQDKKKIKRNEKNDTLHKLTTEELIIIFNRLETLFQTAYRSKTDVLILSPYDPFKIDQNIIIDIYNYLICKYGYLFKQIYICISPDMTTNEKHESYENVKDIYVNNIILPQKLLNKN